MIDLYAVLNISKSATPEEIKSAYRKKASETHPDKNGGDTGAFQLVQEAYEVLSDPERRKQYDESGETKKVKPKEEIANEYAIEVYMDIVEGADFKPDNYFKLAVEKIKKGVSKCKRDRSILKRNISGLEKLIEGSATAVLIRNALDAKRIEMVDLLDKSGFALDIMNLSIKYLESCEYTGEIKRAEGTTAGPKHDNAESFYLCDAYVGEHG